MKENKQPLTQAIQQLGVVGGQLFRRFPLFMFAIVGILGFAAYSIINNNEGMQIFLCVLISITSFIIFMKTSSYGETILSFMLGILTISTIDWDENNELIFIIVFVLFNVLLFIGTSIKLHAQVETILTHAATFIDLRNYKKVYKELQDLLRTGTKGGQLGALNKAESIRFIAYLGIPVSEMGYSLNAIEIIKVVNNIELRQALNYFRAIYFFKLRTANYNSFEAILDTFFNQLKTIPLSPEEFLIIFDKTKRTVISHEITLDQYFSNLRNLLLSGADEDEIVNVLSKSRV
ncbi:hypothetical protein [Pontibacter amylolyticus]|uniref:FUSC family protein n=1 Tax=Pontibacter amylolyticus TaxID=1424080 RepID=A0ABQ1WAZ0_9BACT|nr:hypothetical protein [Pontibacter amylolyticus]GGG20943.1 hypothetical protein GCM10011323_26130 [Pontibacter amylolyticus]